MGGISFNITSGAFKDTLLCSVQCEIGCVNCDICIVQY